MASGDLDDVSGPMSGVQSLDDTVNVPAQSTGGSPDNTVDIPAQSTGASQDNTVDILVQSTAASPDNTVDIPVQSTAASPDNTVDVPAQSTAASPDNTVDVPVQSTAASPDNTVDVPVQSIAASPDNTVDVPAQSTAASPDNTVDIPAQSTQEEPTAALPVEEQLQKTESAVAPDSRLRRPCMQRSTAQSQTNQSFSALTPHKAHIARLPSPRPAGRVAREPLGRVVISRGPHLCKLVQLSKVSMSTRAKISTSHPSNYVEYPRLPRKVVSWGEAMASRPPLRIDMEGPTPCSYHPGVKPLSETNAPAWSFGQRTFVEKDGGARTSWQKMWFQSQNVWQQKTDFHREITWPSPHQYKLQSTLGPYQQTYRGAPSHSISTRLNKTTTASKKVSAAEPSPNDYNREKCDIVTFKAAPSYSHGLRRGGTYLWAAGEGLSNPGPGTYEPSLLSVQSSRPPFTIQGIRRHKSYYLGPFATF